MKKLLAILMMLVLIVSLGACKKDEKTQKEGDVGKENKVEKKEEPSQESEITEINFWHSADGKPGEIIERQVEKFNTTIGKEKNIKVVTTFQDWPGTDSLTAAMSVDDIANMPDVIQLYGPSVDIVRDWDRTEWVEDYINKSDSSVKKENLIENAVSSFSIDEKMIGAPFAISTLVMYYNADLLAQAGHEEAPKTIDELSLVMKDIKEKTDADYSLNIRIEQYEFENFMATQGKEGSYFGNNESGHKGKMTEIICQEQINNFINEWQKVVETGALKPTKDSMNEEFAQGLNAMTIMSSSKIATITELVGDSFNWGVAPVPKVAKDDVGGGYPSGSALFMVDRDDQDKLDASWTFISFMLSSEAQSMWLEGYSYVPVNKETLNDDLYKSAVEANPRLSVPFDILLSEPKNVVASFCPSSGEVATVIKDAMINYGHGEVGKDETETIIIEGINKAFEDYFRANPVDK